MSDNHNVPLVSYEIWVAALASSASIGLASLVPWIFNMTFFEKHSSAFNSPKDSRMNCILSFAVGAILGDLFFHLIPESYGSHSVDRTSTKADAHKQVGLSIIAGIFMFIIVELVLEKWSHNLETLKSDKNQTPVTSVEKNSPTFGKNDLNSTYESQPSLKRFQNQNENHNNNNNNNNNVYTNLNKCQINYVNSFRTIDRTYLDDDLSREQSDKSVIFNQTKVISSDMKRLTELKSDKLLSSTIVDPAGYLNLIANSFDNFTHGLAIGASFLVGAKVGLLTTFVIFIHEVPHEICDYAILVNSGFSRLEAVKAQSSVSLFSLLGTAIALYVRSVETLTAQTVWILPFSAGGFLYIALVNLLPEILDFNSNFQDTLMQVACVILGISFMGAVAIL